MSLCRILFETKGFQMIILKTWSFFFPTVFPSALEKMKNMFEVNDNYSWPWTSKCWPWTIITLDLEQVNVGRALCDQSFCTTAIESGTPPILHYCLVKEIVRSKYPLVYWAYIRHSEDDWASCSIYVLRPGGQINQHCT